MACAVIKLGFFDISAIIALSLVYSLHRTIKAAN